ncbi:Chemotaxis protein CheY [Peribacillus simplex]|uniref:Chemotaxis protein CheY n=1 Tax=Peribacillus simplex TaxID=1478 RepID=A0A9W4LA54_9BACI|nr:Chemotaxis protein CheY [Peribacillus simplex]
MARIFIVEDAKFMKMTLSNILPKAGHEVVSEGREAIE